MSTIEFSDISITPNPVEASGHFILSVKAVMIAGWFDIDNYRLHDNGGNVLITADDDIYTSIHTGATINDFIGAWKGEE